MSRVVTRMTIDDAEHYTAEQRQAIIDSYPPHEREARIKGIPSMGSGRVFPITEEAITVDAFSIPDSWVQVVGIDFGWDHPTAATKLAWDRDADCIYVTAEYAQREATPVIHAAAIKAWGDWLPVAWPHDGLQHDKQSGDQLAEAYRKQGLNMMSSRAMFEDDTSGVEAGVMEMLDRMQTGRWKVFRNCGKWFGEFRLYHREDGLIVKERDDVICSSRYAMMMRRFGKTKPVKTTMTIPDYGAA
jgi:hypothetical protein